MTDYKIVDHLGVTRTIPNVEKLLYTCDLFKFIFKDGTWHIIEASTIKSLSTI